MAENPVVADAIDVVARKVLHDVQTNPENFVEFWEDYPNIGEDDWERVVDRIVHLAQPVYTASFDAAYEFLGARAAEHDTELGQ